MTRIYVTAVTILTGVTKLSINKNSFVTSIFKLI